MDIKKEGILMYKLICSFLVLLLFFNCKSTTGPEANLKVSTDKKTYQESESVIVYIENETNSTAYFYHCNFEIGFYVEKKEDHVWVQAFSHAIWCPAFYLNGIIELAPGEKDTTEITGWNWTPGVYRISAPYASEKPESFLTDSLHSNEFTVQ